MRNYPDDPVAELRDAGLEQALLVETVTGLVHGGSEGVVDVVLMETSRHSNIVAVRTAAERMSRDIETTPIEIEAQLGSHLSERRAIR